MFNWSNQRVPRTEFLVVVCVISTVVFLHDNRNNRGHECNDMPQDAPRHTIKKKHNKAQFPHPHFPKISTALPSHLQYVALPPQYAVLPDDFAWVASQGLHPWQRMGAAWAAWGTNFHRVVAPSGGQKFCWFRGPCG